MTGPGRRAFMRAGATAAVWPMIARARTSARLVVVGGGFAGATVARFVRRLASRVAVTLVEPKARYVACPMSNLVLAGHRTLQQQSFPYTALAAQGIEVVRDVVLDVDASARRVSLGGGAMLAYDRLVLAPGIAFRPGGLPGYDAAEPATTDAMPHAWQAGPQTDRLRRQLQDMPDDGLVLMSVPPAPFRCPPGPYERASLIAGYLRRAKPRAKLMILDGNDRFSKQPLFEQAWQPFGDRITWRSASNDGRVVRVDPERMRLHTDFEQLRADVVNVIPPQQAAQIAHRAGVADATGWCPIDPVSFASSLQPDVHVLGDAAIAAPMPKSAFAANAQAKVCAIQLARLFQGLDAEPSVLSNTCYSFLDAQRAISISGVYRTHGGRFDAVPAASGLSPLDAPPALRQREARHAEDWFAAITRETFG